MAPSSLIIHMSHVEREGLRALAEQQGISEREALRGLLQSAIPPTPPAKPKRRYFGCTGKWEETKAYAADRVAAHGYVSASDLMRDIGMSYGTATKYIDLLISHFEWTSEPAVRPPRGKVAGLKV